MELNKILQGFLHVLVLLVITSKSHCANILFFHGVSTYSHRIAVWNLVEKLVDRGHNITFFQPIPPKPEHSHPNVTNFFPQELQDALKQPDSSVEDSFFNNRLKMHHNINQFIGSVHILPAMSLNICSKLLSTTAGLNWVNTSKYELVIVDAAYNECGLALAYLKFDASKVIYFGTSTIFSWHYEPFGIFPESSWLPDLRVSYKYPMNFYERTVSTLLPLLFYYYKVWIYYPQLESILKGKLQLEELPLSIQEMEKNVNLMFLNTHFTEEFARSLPPFVIPVGGITVSKMIDSDKNAPNLIPRDLEKFLNDSSDNGFILVSFGSAVKISHAPEPLRNIFYTAFKNSKTRFVWKWEGERPKEMPDNVYISDWIPQRELLAHPSIRAFMTHGGLISIHEAIINAVPLLVLPVFAEQDYNSFRIERLQRGIRLEISTLKLEELQQAIDKILSNSIYKENMMKTRKLFLDRPETPLQSALWWIDYVLRHSDTNHLKPLSINQFWYERRLLDVWFFVFGIILMAIGFLWWMIINIKKIFTLLRYIVKQKKNKQKISKSANLNTNNMKIT